MKPVLLVEDNPRQQLVIVEAIEACPNTVVSITSSGEAALAKLLAWEGDRPVVVFLDLSLPDLPGIEVLRKLRDVAETRRIPIVVLTAAQSDIDVYTSYRLGANAYLIKPLGETELRRVVEQTASFWLNCNVRPTRS